MIKIKKENEIISLQDETIGSIKHYVSLANNRCTFYSNEYMRETCRPSLNVAATYEEVENLRNVFTNILNLMQKDALKIKKAKIEKHPSGKRGFLITTMEGKKISLLDFSDVMKTAPKILKDTCYQGWEAWDEEETFRAETSEKVIELLKEKYVLNF